MPARPRAARSLKTIKLGGLTAVMAGGRRMHELGMHVNLAGKIADSSIASAAIVHLGAALPQLDWDVSVTCQYLAQDIVRDPVRIERGHARISDRPGLGIEVDESRLSAFRRIAGRGCGARVRPRRLATPGGTRTSDLQLRRLLLYPAELRGR